MELVKRVSTGILAGSLLIAHGALPAQPEPARALSPAELQIQLARERIAARGLRAEDLNSLAIGLTRRARESGDASFYERALDALEESRRIDPDNPETLKITAWVRMGRHEFSRALRLARRFVRERPEDTAGLGVLGDALMELGRYDEAEEVFQRMNDQRPGPVSYSRAAYLREVRGDPEGALELMRLSLAATGRREAEDRAWFLVQIGHLQEQLGDSAGAGSSYRGALELFPGYHYALAALAGVALREGEAGAALSFARAALEAAPHAERYLLLADALRALGREEEARAAEGRFEVLALANGSRADNENHDLVLFYLERRPDPPRALAIARQETERRQDAQTLDRLAWALFRNGKHSRASRLLDRVLATGTRDPLIARHAEEMRSSSPGQAGGRALAPRRGTAG